MSREEWTMKEIGAVEFSTEANLLGRPAYLPFQEKQPLFHLLPKAHYVQGRNNQFLNILLPFYNNPYKRIWVFKLLQKGTMDVKVGLLVILVLGASCACDARELLSAGLSDRETATFDVSVLQIELEPEGGLEGSSQVVKNEHFCTLCEEFAAEALEYLQEDKTQTEVIEMLHNTCSQLRSFEQQCITLVDYYVPLFFDQVGSVEPGDFCQKVNLCEQAVIASPPQSEDKCEICHHAVAEVLLKLKDPDTKLEIIEILLKACNAMEGHVKKCKTLVFEYGPLILTNAEQFLEKTDMCNAIRACDSPSADSNEATQIEKTPMLSVM